MQGGAPVGRASRSRKNDAEPDADRHRRQNAGLGGGWPGREEETSVSVRIITQRSRRGKTIIVRVEGAGVLEEVPASAAVARERAAAADVELRALAVELRFGDVAAVGDSSRVGEPVAEHRRDEGRWRSHDIHRTSVGGRLCSPRPRRYCSSKRFHED